MKFVGRTLWLILLSVAAQAVGQPGMSQHSVEQALKQFPWLMAVSSDYPDYQEAETTYSLQGFGFVVRHGHQKYLITAAHLSQGAVEVLDTRRQELKIHSGQDDDISLRYFDRSVARFTEAKYQRSIADNFQDIEIFALPDGDVPSLAYVCEVGNGAQGFCLEDNLEPEVDSATSLVGKVYLPLGLDGFIPNVVLEEIAAKHFPMIGQDPQIVSSTIMSPNRQISPFRHQVGLDLVDAQTILPAKISPGMSGLPFINTQNRSQPMVLGLVQSRARHFHTGWMSDAANVLPLVKALAMASQQPGSAENGPRRMIAAGRSGILAEWQVHRGELIRLGYLSHLKLHVLEVAPFYKRERLESGNGSRADTGNGSRADTGEPTVKNTGPLTEWGMLVRSEEHGIDDWTHVSQIWVRSENNQYVFPANFAGAKAVSALSIAAKRKGFPLKLNFLTPDATFMPLIRNQVAKRAIQTGEGLYQTTFWVEPYFFDPEQKVFPVQVSFRFLKGRLQVDMDLGFDRIEFDIGEKGNLIGHSERYQPVIKVTSEADKAYWIDFNNMIFTDLSRGSVRHPAFRNRFLIRQNDQHYVFYNRFQIEE